jgi:RNA polymerase sigma-70 factor (ECF subfamily)
MDTTPISLLERLRRGPEPDDWGRFVELYTPVLYDWSRRLGLQEQDAADLVQDVFTTLVQKLPQCAYAQHKSFRGWLRTLAFNKWRDRQRARGTRPLGSDPDAIANLPAAESDPFWEAEYRSCLVRRALEVMQTEFQASTWKACWEFVVQERPASDVASELGISENAVYIAKLRVLRRLRQELEGLVD